MKKSTTNALISMSLLICIVILVAGCESNDLPQTTEKSSPAQPLKNPGDTSQNIDTTQGAGTSAGVEPLNAGTQEESTDSALSVRTVTVTELAEHNVQADCWVAYKGNVYDMTDWIPKHPGGIIIGKYCGTSMEFQNAFLRKHTEKMEGKLKEVTTYIGVFSNETGTA